MIMKKLIALMVIISCAGCMLAQDVISLKNGERIENVTALSITDSVVVYMVEGKEIQLPHNSVDAILYADGRYVEIKETNVRAEDTYTSLFSDSVIEEHPYLKYYDSNGHLRAAFLDKTYSKECRKIGEKVYYKEFKALFRPAYKKAKKSGLSLMKASEQALDEVLPIIVEDSDKAVRECAGE